MRDNCLKLTGRAILITFMAAILTAVPARSARRHPSASGARVPLVRPWTATLSGIVVDERNAVVPDARVSVSDTSEDLQRQATTSRDGDFTIPLLPPGSYTVRAERQGFSTAEITDLVLNSDEQLAIKIQLKVGDFGEKVTSKRRLRRCQNLGPSTTSTALVETCRPGRSINSNRRPQPRHGADESDLRRAGAVQRQRTARQHQLFYD